MDIGALEDQTIRIRDIGDGRGYTIDIWVLYDLGRRTLEDFNLGELEFEDINVIKTLTDNRKVGCMVPGVVAWMINLYQSEGMEDRG